MVNLARISSFCIEVYGGDSYVCIDEIKAGDVMEVILIMYQESFGNSPQCLSKVSISEQHLDSLLFLNCFVFLTAVFCLRPLFLVC